MNVTFWGIVGIGFIIGWLVYYAVRRTQNFQISTVTAVIGVIAGGAVSKFLGNTPDWLGPYGIGLAAGFVSYLVLSLALILGKPRGDPGPGPANTPELVPPGPILLTQPLGDQGSREPESRPSESHSAFDAAAGVRILEAPGPSRGTNLGDTGGFRQL
jgi:hypothetical protein